MVIFRFLGQNDLKLELRTFDFKNKVPKQAAFTTFCQNKALLAKTHSFEQLWKKNDAIGNKTENSRVPS